MEDLPFIWGGFLFFFLSHSSVWPFPCLRFRPGLSPFWSSLSLCQSISSRGVLAAPPGLSSHLNPRRGQMSWKERSSRRPVTSLYYRAEIYTGGHKSQGEREGGAAHIKGSECGDREVNWPSQSGGWTAHLHTFTPCPPARTKTTPTHPAVPCCLLFPPEESRPPRYFNIISRA